MNKYKVTWTYSSEIYADSEDQAISIAAERIINELFEDSSGFEIQDAKKELEE